MKFLRLTEVRNRVPFGRATIYRKIAEGKFPKPYDMGGGRAVAWLESDIDAWIEACVNGRPAPGADSPASRLMVR